MNNKNNPPKRKRKTNYLNNKDLLAETLISLENKQISDKLAHMLMLLVKRLSKKGNFANYTYNDDMQAYALMMHMKTWKGFNPEKSSNPFAFYTQCTKNSFIQFLNKERRQRDIRDAMWVNQGMDPSHTYAAQYQIKVEDEENIDHNESEKEAKIDKELG